MQRSDPNTVLDFLQQLCLSLLADPAYTALHIDDEYALQKGVLRSSPITLHTRRFSGVIWRSLTIAWIIRDSDQALCSLTLVGLPSADSGAPILGVDLICLHGALSLVAIDLAPTDDAGFARVAAPRLVRLAERTQDAVTKRKRPDFCHDTFSPHALICAAKPDQQTVIQQAIADFLAEVLHPGFREHFAAELSADAAQTAWQRQLAWLRSEQANRKEANAMSLMFGEERARRYLCSFLFEVPHV